MAAAIAAILSCKHEPYETGDGDLSYMRADYADITITSKQVSHIVTDDDVSLPLPTGIAVRDDMPSDTILRRLLHYNQRDAASPIELLNITPVAVLTPHDRAGITEMKTDPVKLTGAWLSRNRRYINLHLGLMTSGAADPASPQLVQTVLDSVHTAGRGAAFITLYHDQSGTPEYFTHDVYLSLSTDNIVPSDPQPDTVSITINTYEGVKTHVFRVKNEE